MIPRGTLDISWPDLLASLGYCLLPTNPARVQARVEARWSQNDDTLACLSVRSGFDLLLQVLSLPVGSEVLVSAVTIPDMVQIVTHHGLIPIPIDIDPETLAADPAQIRHFVGAHTKAILVAHLFGSRMPLDGIIDAARQHGLLVIEDCAQAYDGSSYHGHAASDISMFSFGPIKMQTALGGGLLRVRDPSLLAKLRRRQAQYARQSRYTFLRRVGRFILLKALARPWLFSLFIVVCRLRALDHDALLNQAMRGFGGPNLIMRLRRQPSGPLLRLLERRLRQADARRIEQRARVLNRLVMQQPRLKRPGARAHHHTHWVLPIESSAPDTLVRLLRAHGFDATRKASSLVVVPPAQHQSKLATQNAAHMLGHLVYLPVSPGISQRQMARMHQIITDFECHRTNSATPKIAVVEDRHGYPAS